MNQPAHKTEGVNRTKRVWFYPFVFTGKERDEETGYRYFGARYMDHELTTMWLSVDPMADKYPSLSPYVYCAWNPVKLVDPDGKNWKVVVNHENKSITIIALYAVRSNDRESAEIAIKTWNDLSGRYNLKVGNEKYNIVFDLSLINESEYIESCPYHNSYRLVPQLNKPDELGTTYIRRISVLKAYKDDYLVSSHEIGHSLGLEHHVGTSGLMEKDGGRLSGHHEITKDDILSVIYQAFHPEKKDNCIGAGEGSFEIIGNSTIDITKRHNIDVIDN